MKKNGFALVFVIAVVSALSIMTGAMFFYYDNDLKSVSRNSVMQQVHLAAETGLQEGQKWITDQLNSNSFSLVNIQNNLHIDDSDNKCLNRHGFTDSSLDVYYAKKLTGDLGTGDKKFEDMSYEVFVQRHEDVVRSIYFSADGSSGESDQDTTYTDRSFALVENFKDFPSSQFTIEFWFKNVQEATDTYDMNIFEFGRSQDLVFKVEDTDGLTGDIIWSPRMGEDTIATDETTTVGDTTDTNDEWVHIAWVWEGGTSGNDTDNVKIYINGEMDSDDEYDFDLDSVSGSNYTNPPESLPVGDFWPLAIGEGLAGFSPNNYKTGDAIIKSLPFKGNIAELRIWDVARSSSDISDNYRKRLKGSEPGLVSYYKFNEGTGNIAKDSNTSRAADRKNNATIYGIGTKGTLWKTEREKYNVTSDVDDTAPVLNVPPGEDLIYYKILSCGKGPQDQIVPLELIVSAPLQKGDIGDGKIVLTAEDLNSLTGQEGTPKKVYLSSYIAQSGVEEEINIDPNESQNTNIYAFKRSMEQCSDDTRNSFTDFDSTSSYDEGDCVEYGDKLWYLEKDTGYSVGDDFDYDDWAEVLGGDCDGVQFKTSSGDDSYGHYYKYFSTAPNVTSGGDLGYNRDSIDWWEAKRRAEQSTCGGMRGYLVSIDSAEENEFIKDAIMCDSSAQSGCSGVTPFHIAANETRANYYGTRLDASSDQHYVWLSNSDWRNPSPSATNMRSESGPNMGESNGYSNWQSGEPNNAAEPYADMEINRSGRTNGKWNDLRRIPNCSGSGLDCITGYVVEYGGFDSFRMQYNHDPDEDDNFTDDEDVDLEDRKICIARASIEVDKYVSGEDYLKYDTSAEDAPSDISGDNTTASDTDTADDWLGWDEDNGVLTLVHSEKPDEWDPAEDYDDGDFVWYNNRVWEARIDITGGSTLTISKTPTIHNSTVTGAWELLDMKDSAHPCDDKDVWLDAFESIKYYNDHAVDAEEGTNPYAYEDGGTLGSDSDSDDVVSLGERVILFSLGPLHVQKHLDGYNHFYEFYKFPVRASGTQDLYNNNNRRFNEAFQLSNRLTYFGKTGYLATITSEEESEITIDKAKGNGWLGGMVVTDDMNTDLDLETCAGPRQRPTRILAAEDWKNLRTIEDWEYYIYDGTYSTGDYIMNFDEVLGSGADHATSEKNISSVSNANPSVVTTSSNHGLIDDDIIKVYDRTTGELGYSTLDKGYYRVVKLDDTTFEIRDLISREAVSVSYSGSNGSIRELQGLRTSYNRVGIDFDVVNNELSSDINSITDTIPLTDASDFPSSGTIKIYSTTGTELPEIITYTGKSGNNLTGATRGALRSSQSSGVPSAHSDGDKVYLDISYYGNHPENISSDFSSDLSSNISSSASTLPIDSTSNFPTIVSDLNGDINSSATTLTVDDTSDFPRKGMIKIDNEIIEYNGKNDSTNQLTGLTRGREGTTATSHSNNDDVGVFLRVRIGLELIDYVKKDSDSLNEVLRARESTSATSHNVDSPVSFVTYTTRFFQDAEMRWWSGSGNTRTEGNASATTNNTTDCPRWRWTTGPEQFIYNSRGLAFSPSRVANATPSANNGTWTRSSSTGGPSGQQVGEKFKDGMPFRNFRGTGSTGEPNNANSTEGQLHMLGEHFGTNGKYKWNDLHNWSRPHGDDYGIRGIILEYGGMENDGDAITRIVAKRVIKLVDRRVSKAIVKIKSGSQTGDGISANTEDLTNLGITATNNGTSTVTLTGDATCQNYLDLIQGMYFKQNGKTAGIRDISVEIGDAKKPTGADHYFKFKDVNVTYEQANFQASYTNLCGLQGYLGNVTTTADLNIIKSLGITDDKDVWINGTDECQGGIFRSGFWRYTSGPWKDKEFWRLRINSTINIESEAACNETSLRTSESSVRVGPFQSTNWLSSHPAADNNDYLAFQKKSDDAENKIKTRDGTASSDIEGYIIRYGGSVGDYDGADLEEDGNNIDVLLAPIRAEISFYNDGSENSIFISGEDDLEVASTGDMALSSNWAISQDFTSSSNSPMKITPPDIDTYEIATLDQWRSELAKIYYINTDTSDFTPGNRRIKIKLVYTDTSLNEEIGIVKTIGARNTVQVTPEAWSNR